MIICLDFESYYDKDYSLTKMPVHAYIRDPRWRCLGCGFQFEGEAPFYVEDPEPIFKKIDAYGWDRITLLAHNCVFDGSVLFERFGRTPGRWLDTRLITRWAVAQGHLPPEQGASLSKLAPLVGMTKGDTWSAVHGGGQALADYGTDDVITTVALLKLLMRFSPPSDELDYMDMHIRMSTEPVLQTDREALATAAIVTPEEAELAALLRKESNMAALLEQYGVPLEYKTTATGKRKLALAKPDAFMQSLLVHDNDKVAQLASLRLDANSNITRTRALTLLDVGNPLPFPVLYHGAHTGRGSGCLVAEAEIIVYDVVEGVIAKQITDVMDYHLVWDGVEFVTHGGVKFSGYQEVITHDGITGTPDHKVFTAVGTLTLAEGHARQENITSACLPVGYGNAAYRAHKKG